MISQAEIILKNHKLRNTKIRRDVLNLFVDHSTALSHHEIENGLQTVDRVTLYRTLKTFEENGIVHKAIDGTEKPKFALCAEHCQQDEHFDDHAHFHCEKCNRTFCVEEMASSPYQHMFNNMEVKSISVILRGYCEDCK